MGAIASRCPGATFMLSVVYFLLLLRVRLRRYRWHASESAVCHTLASIPTIEPHLALELVDVDGVPSNFPIRSWTRL